MFKYSVLENQLLGQDNELTQENKRLKTQIEQIREIQDRLEQINPRQGQSEAKPANDNTDIKLTI